MIKYYKSLSWRLGTQLKTREPDGVGHSPNVTSSKLRTSWLTSIFILFIFLTSGNIWSQVSAYTFAESTETYAQITGTTSTATGDDGTQTNIPIGFTFNFGGVDYTTFSITTNGMIRLGGAAIASGWTNSLGNSATLRPLIAPFWDDNNLSTGTIRYSTTGAPGSQVLTVNWHNTKIGSTGSTAGASVSTLLRLYETTNIIEMVYGSPFTTTNTVTASVGLNDMTSFLSVTPAATSSVSSITANNSINATAMANLAGKKLTFSPPPACIAPPNPGNTLASATVVCSGSSVTLSLQNTTSGSGVTYQWQSSANNVDWTDISGATSATRVVNPTAATYYRCNVTCSAQTVPSNSIQVTLDPNFLACYNTNAASSTADEEISNVTVGTLNNSSDCSTLAPGTGSILNRYSNYRGSIAVPDFARETSVSFSLTQTSCGGSFGNGFQIYIDFNQNGFFEDTERVYNQPVAATGNHTKTGDFSIPVGALLGNTGMRVVVVETTFPTTTNYANTAYSWGETEDYIVNIVEAPACLPPLGLAASFSTGSVVNLSWNIPSPAPGVGFEWAFTTSSTPPASGTPVATNTATSSWTPGTAYYLHVRSECVASTGYSTWTTFSAPSPLVTAVPWVEGFATTSLPAQWTNNSFTVGSSTGAGGNPGNTIYKNLYSFATTGSFTTPNLGTIAANQVFAFDYRLANFSSPYDPPSAGSGNYVVEISTDYGATYTALETVANDGVAGWRNKSYSLSAYAGQDVKIRIIGNWTSGDYYLAFDNFTVSSLCEGTPVGGTVDVTSQSVCPAFPLAPITVTGASSDPGITYQWEESTNGGSTWANATGGSGSTTTTYQPPVYAGTVIQYRLKVTCTNSSEVNYSTISEVNSNPSPVPFTETFTDLSGLTGWSTSGFSVGTVRGATGNPSGNAYTNLWSSNPTSQLTTANYGPIVAGQAIMFDYQLSNYSSPYAPPAADSGNFEVFVSTNCGTTFTSLGITTNDGVAGYRSKVYSLSAFVGQNILVRIVGTWVSGDYDLSIDNLSIMVPPPSITSFDPPFVCEDSESVVTITGEFFDGVTNVSVGSSNASFNFVDSNTITFTLPLGASTDLISVTTPGGTSSSSTELIVNPYPIVNPITGADTALCMPNTLVLSSTSPGGTWSSSNEAVATVVGGTVTGVSEGTVTISYSVTDNGCTTVVTYDVDVNEPVVISSFTPSQTVVTGNDATFTVAATGTGLTYQWYAFDGSDSYPIDAVFTFAGEVYSGYDTDTLVITGVPGDINGLEVFCTVSGVSPCTPVSTTPNSQLFVGDTGIASDPSSVTLCDGGSTTFTVVRSGDDLEEDITYQWQYNGDNTENWFDLTDGTTDGMLFSGSATSVLSVSGIDLSDDGYRFRAVVTGPANFAISNPATLSVNEGVSIATQPSSALVCRIDTSANFSITAAGDVTGIQWQSSPNGVDSWTNVGTGASLTVAVSASSPVGVTYYRAVVSGNTPCLPLNSDVVTLTVQQPTIEVTPSSATYCLPGDAVSLTASGAVSYTWAPATGLSATTGATVSASPTVTTTYTVTGTDANGCSNSTSVTVSVSSQISGDATADLTEVCADNPVQLGITPVQVSPSYPINSASYRFEATSGTFTPLVGGTSSGLIATADDANSASLPIGFSFNYGGTNYTNFRVNSNGLMVFNTTGNTSGFNSLSTTTASQRISLAPLWDDLQCTSGVTYQVSGTAPNRVLTVEWLNMEWNWSSTVGISFQVKLYEGTNIIEYVYRPEAGGNPTGSSGASIGLMGTAAANYISLSDSSAAPSISTTTSTNSIGVKPAAGQIYRFIPSAPVTYTYAWSSTPSGFASTDQNPVANPSETTTYSVVVTSSAGCTHTSEVTVNVVSGAVIETQPVALSQCEGTDASFSVVATGPSLTYQWRKDGIDIVGATSATLDLTAISATDDASYDVVVTPLCGAAVTSDAVTLTVNLLPTVDASNSGIVCEGENITLTATSDIPGSTFAWTGPNGFSSTEQNPVLSNVTMANVGEYTVTVTSPQTCESTASTSVSVNPNAPLEITVSGSATTACVGELKALTASANSVGSVEVSFGTNLESTGVTGGVTFPATISGIPAGAVVTSAELQFTNVNSINGSWRSEIRVALTGAHVLGATQISTLGSGGLISPDPTVNVPGFTATSGAINLVLTESFNDGGATVDATFGTAVLVINYALPAPDVTWSPSTDLYTDEGGTVPYTGGFATTVYAKVSATSPTSYTASSVNVLGCESAASYSYTLTTTGCPSTTVVQPSQCGQTLATIDSYVYANLVAGAQGYRFRVTDMTTNEVQTIDRALRVFRLTQLTNYAFDRTYMVEVAVRRNNVWESFYGTGCTVSTPDTTTQIQASQCNTVISNVNNAIFADIVPFATGYRFRVTNTLNPIDVQTIDRPIRDFRMNLLSNIQYNTTYNVEVAVRNTDGTYLSYGPVCNITTPLFPTVGLEDAQCDEYMVSSNTEVLYAESYPGVEQYRFLLENISQPYSQTVDRATRTVSLSNFTGLLPGEMYTVRVAIRLNGVWGPYGKSCSIITPGAGRPDEVTRVDQTAVNEFKAIAYPNPFATSFTIDVKTSNTEAVSLTVYDMAGRLLEVKEVKAQDVTNYQFGDRYPSGVYNVIVTQGNETRTVRVVKQ